jgi:DNA-directed RNA polymerase subunit beta'
VSTCLRRRDHYDAGLQHGQRHRGGAVEEGDETLIPLRTRVLGRTALYEIRHPATGDILIPANAEIDEPACKKLEEAGIERVWIRSGLTCDAPHGMCAKCYGRDLSTGKPVEIGTAVGIIAARPSASPARS